MKKTICFIDTEKARTTNIICNTYVFAILLYTSVVHYPHVQQESFSDVAVRTFFIVVPFAVGELITDIYIVMTLEKEVYFEWMLRTSGVLILFLGWLLSLAVVMPLQMELAYDDWDIGAYRAILAWNWIRIGIWGVRFALISFNAYVHVREEQNVSMPKYTPPLDDHKVFTFDDDEE